MKLGPFTKKELLLVHACSLNQTILVQSRTIEPAMISILIRDTRRIVSNFLTFVSLCLSGYTIIKIYYA